MKNGEVKNNKILAFLISALFLYLAGIVTGVYLGSNIAITSTSSIKEKALSIERALENIQRKLDNTETILLFILSSPNTNDLDCKLMKQMLDPVFQEIADMLKYLPHRLETAKLPYSIENKYSNLNTKAYIEDYLIYKKCGGKKLPVLYIYSHGDLNSGLTMDKLREEYNLSVFVAWKGSDNPIIKALKPSSSSVYVCNQLVSINEANEAIRRCLGYS